MNLASLLDDHPGDRTALVAAGDRVSYGRLRDEIDATRGVLAGLGLEPGDRVAILCATNLRFVRAWFGVIGAGFVAVPLNPQAPAPEIERELSAVGARAAIVGPAGVTAMADLDRAAVPTLQHVLVPTGVELDGSVDLDEAVEMSSGAPLVARDDDDLAVLLFTSGTAGSPKPAMLTHGNLAANIRQMQSRPDQVVRPDDVSICVVPLFHVLGLNSILDLSLWAGATLVLVERFDPMSMLDLIEHEQVSVLAGPPTMWAALVQTEAARPETFARIRIAISGAAAIPDRVVVEARDRLGLRIHEGYGLTEASPSVTVASGDDTPIGSIGRVIPGVEVRLVDEAGDDVYIGDPGEILVRGPNVFTGYFGDTAATQRVLDADGWLHTGDIAVVDDDGWLFLVDRAKDLIIVSGFNVYPAEVERVLTAHPAVAEAGVVGVPHPYSGEAVKAFVVVEADAAVEEDDLIAWCAAELAHYKCPSKIDVVDEIPRGLGGKVLRRELR
ncbi:MAG: AMP-binding protein [Acidimicrobiales bacterium]